MLKDINIHLKDKWRLIILVLLAPVFFVIYSWLPYQTQGQGVMQFNSPDETGNYFWTSRLAEGKPLYVLEPLENTANNLIRLRGMNVADGKLVPGSFLGMNFIYGLVGKWTTPDIIPYLTPLFAVIGVLFLYALIALIFDKQIALISSLLAFALPGWMYFANRSMFHNVLFVALLIIGVYLLVKVLLRCHSGTKSRVTRDEVIESRDSIATLQDDNKRKCRWLELLQYSLSGILIGLSLITRLSELGWVSLLLLLIFIFHFRKINWLGFALFASFLISSLVPVFATNLVLYNAPLSVGYDTGLVGELGGILTQAPLLFRLLISPFGFHPVSIVLNGFNYIVQFFWWLTLPAFFGIIFWLFSPKERTSFGLSTEAQGAKEDQGVINPKKMQWAYFVIMLVVSCYLLIFYGSWQITDRIDNSTLSTGTSYVRYFLPIYLMMLPFVAILINTFLKIFKPWPLAAGLTEIFLWRNSTRGAGLKQSSRRKFASPAALPKFYGVIRFIVGALVILFLSVPSFLLVGWTTDESLLTLKETLRVQSIKAEKVQAIVSAEAVVVAGFKQADKIVFPERRVIPELAVPHDYESLAKLAQIRPLYYYHFAPTSTVGFISRRDFEEFGLKIDVASEQRIFSDERLYKIELIK